MIGERHIFKMVNGDTKYLGDALWWLFKRDGIAQYGKKIALASYSDYFINVFNTKNVDCCVQCSGIMCGA